MRDGLKASGTRRATALHIWKIVRSAARSSCKNEHRDVDKTERPRIGASCRPGAHSSVESPSLKHTSSPTFSFQNHLSVFLSSSFSFLFFFFYVAGNCYIRGGPTIPLVNGVSWNMFL